MLDLSKADDVLQYLSETPFASTLAERLSGGNVNFLFRLHLCTPYEGRTTLVLKHAKPWVGTTQNWSYGVNRQEYEAKALIHVKKLLPADSLATVPSLHLFDASEHVLIMDDCGPGTLNLKQLMKESPPTIEAAREIGEALGSFLAAVHTKGSEDKELMEFTGTNERAKRLTAAVTYGGIRQTLVGEEKEASSAFDPPLDIASADLVDIDRIVEQRTEAIMGAETTYTMGDFWTGNIIVQISQGASGTGEEKQQRVERIFVVDWEVTKPGLAFLDVGQFVAEMHTLYRFHERTQGSVESALRAFFAAYKANGVHVDEAFVRAALTHIGAHLVVITPWVGWSPKEILREVVLEGTEYLLQERREIEWVEKTVMGPLLS